MTTSLQDHLREAMRLTLVGRLDEATRAVQLAMSAAAAEPGPAPGAEPTPPRTEAAAWRADAAPRVLDGLHYGAAAAAPPAPTGEGSFNEAMYRDGPRQGRYKLFVPPGHEGRLLPLVVMLHGCAQDADDFAAGTAMNRRACEQGFFVLYPEQSRQANAARCWNWFKPTQRQRGAGEPALIAGMTQAVMQRHGVDARRVYIAGFAAGGAMAAIVAAAYPDVFAAVGVHSGLPAEAAEALVDAVVVSGAPVRRPVKAPVVEAVPPRLVPTIVFHGDLDHVVPPSHGERVVAVALLQGQPAAEDEAAPPAGPQTVEHGVSARGRPYTRTLFMDAAGATLAEQWLVKGAGHGWSGGNADASYTDPSGPDASLEMLRFFAEHPRPA